MKSHSPIENRLPLPAQRSAYYGGAWHEPASGRYVDTVSPGTGQSLGTVALCGIDDVGAAVSAAKRAFGKESKMWTTANFGKLTWG